MKIKKINKKLAFSKSTIADLHSNDLNVVRGGYTDAISCGYSYCNTCQITCPYTCDDMTCYREGTYCVF